MPSELNAKRKKAPAPALAAGGDAVPELKAVLERAGWFMTPEWTDQYQPGHVYYGGNQLWAQGSECFEAAPLESAYSSMEVRRSLEAGVAMDAVVNGARADLVVSKKIIFDTPNLREIPGRGLYLTEGCLADLKKARDRGEDLSTFYVVTSVLSARIQKQQCGSYDAKAGLFRVSAEVDVINLCGVDSDVPVAIAYKTKLIGQIAPELKKSTGSSISVASPVDFSDPRSVLNFVFVSVQQEQYSALTGVCDPGTARTKRTNNLCTVGNQVMVPAHPQYGSVEEFRVLLQENLEKKYALSKVIGRCETQPVLEDSHVPGADEIVCLLYTYGPGMVEREAYLVRRGTVWYLSSV